MYGYSKKIVANATMPTKNNLAIYDSVYRSVLNIKFEIKYFNCHNREKNVILVYVL